MRRKAVFGRTDDGALKPGDVVEVRAPAEILATLDADGSLDGMPFMPEMVPYSGRRFTVSRRVEKICDTVKTGGPPQSRRMRDTVLLEDLRCDGSGHDGCQAGCRLYWKEAWLRRVNPIAEPEGRTGDGVAQLEQLTRDAARVVREVDGSSAELYRCQATEASRASEPLGNYDLRQYVRELTSRNVGPGHFLRVAVRGLSVTIRRRLRLLGYQPSKGLRDRVRHRLEPLGVKPLPSHGIPAPAKGELNLQPGEMVQVRSPREIAPSIDESGKTRGLSFDWEMLPYCAGRYRVKDRVERIIDERTGKMIEIGSDCLILDGVTCSGERSHGHWFCPRAIYPYWREAWLRRVEDVDSS
jgi:hypothetical protein